MPEPQGQRPFGRFAQVGQRGGGIGVAPAPEHAPGESNPGARRANGLGAVPSGGHCGPEHALGLVEPGEIHPRLTGKDRDADERPVSIGAHRELPRLLDCGERFSRPAAPQQRRGEHHGAATGARPVVAARQATNRLSKLPNATGMPPFLQVLQRDIHAAAQCRQFARRRPRGHRSRHRRWLLQPIGRVEGDEMLRDAGQTGRMRRTRSPDVAAGPDRSGESSHHAPGVGRSTANTLLHSLVRNRRIDRSDQAIRVNPVHGNRFERLRFLAGRDYQDVPL
ncbi:MAG: hypothetical protein DMF97_01855 [Acidobacteria bacterium]|nr:MAG: hypothetical protein DMF97_01855 [Acidobacteriota bacterium]